jgi:hypothetical protein
MNATQLHQWYTHEGSYGNYVAVKDSSGKTVARIPWGDGDASNAKLIAAAPDMLAALEFALHCLETGRKSDCEPQASIRAAIAKATL